jgi:hypothetical protein
MSAQKSQNIKNWYGQRFTQLVKDMKHLVELGKNHKNCDLASGMSVEQCLAFCLKHIDRIDLEGNIPEDLLNSPLVEIRNVEFKMESWTEKRGTWVGMKRL